MSELFDPEAAELRVLRHLHAINCKRIDRALVSLGNIRDRLFAKRAFGESYWYGGAERYGELAEDLGLVYLNPEDLAGISEN